MSLMDEFKKIIHPYDDEDDDYEEDVAVTASRPTSSPVNPVSPPAARRSLRRSGATRW